MTIIKEKQKLSKILEVSPRSADQEKPGKICVKPAREIHRMLECGLSLKPITPNWLKKFKMMRKIMGRDNTLPPREFFAGHVKLPQ